MANFQEVKEEFLRQSQDNGNTHPSEAEFMEYLYNRNKQIMGNAITHIQAQPENKTITWGGLLSVIEILKD
jgi:hypothetical protein